MVQDEENEVPTPVSKLWRIQSIYMKEHVESFWSKTDEKTRNAVYMKAQPRDSEEFHQRIRKKLSKAQTQYLTNCSESELETLLSRYLSQAENRKNQHDEDTRGLKRARSGTSKFLNNFNDYIQAYSSIIQIMNGTGQNYGDAAYGALSLLLVVAVNKEKTEGIVSSMLFTLNEQYSRIQMLKEVYATTRIKEHIAEVYRLGIEFVHQATLYYSIGSFRRFLYLLSQPPSIALEGKVSEIKKAIKEMRMEMETQDRIRLNNVEKKLSDVDSKLDKVEESVEVLHVRAVNVRLETLQHLLQVEEQDLERSVRDYDQRLTDTFGDIRRLPPFDAEGQLFRSADFSAWRRASQSSLILLQGKTVAPDRTLLSWHSPATTRLVRDADKYLIDSKSAEPLLVVYYFCQVREYFDDSPPQMHPPCTVISAVIYQLLKSGKAHILLRDDKRYAKLKHCIEDLSVHPAAKAAEQLSKLYSILAELLTDLALKRVFIVLDRVDRIQGNIDNFLGPLLKLMETTKCVLKVLITIRTERNFDDSMLKESLSGDTYTRVILDQE